MQSRTVEHCLNSLTSASRFLLFNLSSIEGYMSSRDFLICLIGISDPWNFSAVNRSLSMLMAAIYVSLENGERLLIIAEYAARKCPFSRSTCPTDVYEQVLLDDCPLKGNVTCDCQEQRHMSAKGAAKTDNIIKRRSRRRSGRSQ